MDQSRRKGVMMEDNEEQDDDNYPMFPEYSFIATGKQKIKSHQMSPLMMLVWPLLMQRETTKLKRKG
jgi:hypothetical protein